MKYKKIAAVIAAIAIVSNGITAYNVKTEKLFAPLTASAATEIMEISSGITADGLKYGIYGVCEVGEHKKVISKDYVSIKGYEGKKSAVTIPEKIEDLKVKEIADKAFAKNEKIVSIIIPDTVESIGEDAFYSCTMLTKLKLPVGLEIIPKGMCQSCSSLSEIEIPDSVITIGDVSFCGCCSLTKISVPDSVMNLGSSTFEDCFDLFSVKLPDVLASIPDFTFRRCTSLQKIELPLKLTSIGRYAFDNSGLTEINFNEGLKSIGDNAFENCESLRKVKISSSVEQIGKSVFTGCKNLKNINIPQNVKSFGENFCGDYKNVSLTGCKGSAAETFAAKNKIKFNVWGDANNDGKVSAADLVALQKYILEGEKIGSRYSVDLLEDEVVDVYDMVMLRKLVIANK